MPRLWNRLIAPAQRRFRRTRARRIVDVCPEIAGSTIVDIGGSIPFWRDVEDIFRPRSVAIYNISDVRTGLGHRNENARLTIHYYDGVTLPLDDAAADFAICNSVIEHVAPHARASLAGEIMRVGRWYVVQTPSAAFPLDLHFGLPFLHWLPRPVGRAIAPFTPFARLTRVDARRYFDETRLLSARELRLLFPGCTLAVERFAGFPKSLLAIGGRSAGDDA